MPRFNTPPRFYEGTACCGDKDEANFITLIKNYMENTWFAGDKVKKAGITLLVLLSIFVAVKTASEFKKMPYIGKDTPVVNAITVTGKGEVITIPDIASFTVTVSEEGLVVADAQKKATEKANKIIAFLKEGGVEEKDIKTTNYSIYPRYEYNKQVQPYYYDSGKQTLAAYVVTHSIEVRVRKVDDAGKLLSGVGEFGVNDVSGLNFTVDKYDDLVKEARTKAIKEARENAEKLAGDLDVKLVRITGYYDQGNYAPVYYGKEMLMNASADGRGGAMPVPELPAGESKIISNVSITYEIR
jgi:uncharacterized protein YggE